MSIYTKKGDHGKTSLGSGIKVWKNSKRVTAYGHVDELNSFLGVIRAGLDRKKKYTKYLDDILAKIQDDLFCIGSYLSNGAQANLIKGLSRKTNVFEKQIDEMTKELPALSNFILPGGTKTGANLQLARAITRRMERGVVAISRTENINKDVVQYVNRLSDLLFTMSRYINHKEKKKEIIWSRR